jgi:lipoprotein-anchoring transpeptidase ErfK/SrfK
MELARPYRVRKMDDPSSQTLITSRRTFFPLIGSLLLALSVGGCVDARRADEHSAEPHFQRAEIAYGASYPVGTIVVDPTNHYLYLIQDHGRALRYAVGVGGEGYAWSGTAIIKQKREWPNWYPTSGYLQSRPQIAAEVQNLEHGRGVLASPDNPLGARALYLWQDGKDTLYRIHGTNEPWTIGKDVSAGCIRLTNDDVINLYDRVPVGSTVVVLPSTRAPVKRS